MIQLEKETKRGEGDGRGSDGRVREERERGQKVRDVKIMPVKMLTILCSHLHSKIVVIMLLTLCNASFIKM